MVKAVAQHVQKHNVNFLNPHGAIVRHAEVDVFGLKNLVEIAATFAAQSNDRHAAILSDLNGSDHVGRVAAGGDGNQQVALLTQRRDLAGEDIIVAVVVADGGQNRCVSGQRNAGQGKALALKATDQFGDEVLRIGGRAAVTAGQYLVVFGDGLGEEHACPLERLAEYLGGIAHSLQVLLKMLLKLFCTLHTGIIAEKSCRTAVSALTGGDMHIIA